jgi:hypothetical protein
MSDQALLCHLSLKLVRIGDGLSSPWGGVVALYKRRILTTQKHAHNTSIAVLKNTMQNEAYMKHIQYIIEKGSNSSDSLSRIGSTTCNCKRRHGESSVGKVAGSSNMVE